MGIKEEHTAWNYPFYHPTHRIIIGRPWFYAYLHIEASTDNIKR